MSKILQIIIGLSVLLIAGSIFYHYVIFLPQQMGQKTIFSIFSFTDSPVEELESSVKTDVKIYPDTGKEQRDAQRQSDIRQISLAMEMYYDNGQAYLSSASIPGTIGNYLNPIPKDPLGNFYTWINNTEDNQKYCVYANLEKGIFFIATQRGTKTINTKPTNLNNCW